MIKTCLKPAIVKEVEVKGNKAYVWVDEDQRSLAIGKGGQNIALASRLNDIDIDLVQETSSGIGEVELQLDEQETVE